MEVVILKSLKKTSLRGDGQASTSSAGTTITDYSIRTSNKFIFIKRIKVLLELGELLRSP